MHAKPVPPGTFHDCLTCGGRAIPGQVGTLDGWADNEGDYFGSIEEFPDQETADNYLHPDYRPAQRFVKRTCGQGCKIDPLKADENFTEYPLFFCGNCEMRYKSEEDAGRCCD